MVMRGQQAQLLRVLRCRQGRYLPQKMLQVGAHRHLSRPQRVLLPWPQQPSHVPLVSQLVMGSGLAGRKQELAQGRVLWKQQAQVVMQLMLPPPATLQPASGPRLTHQPPQHQLLLHPQLWTPPEQLHRLLCPLLGPHMRPLCPAAWLPGCQQALAQPPQTQPQPQWEAPATMTHRALYSQHMASPPRHPLALA